MRLIRWGLGAVAVLVVGLFIFVFFAATSERAAPARTAGFTEVTLSVAHRDTDLPVRVWERAQDISALLDFAQAGLPLGISADLERVGAMGFSLGGYATLAVAGVTVSKDRFIAYCEAHPDEIDCGWMNEGGLDFQAIDRALYEQDNRDARIAAIVAIDPALPRAITDAGLAALSVPTRIIQLGETETLFEGMRWGTLAEGAPTMEHFIMPDTYHFGFLAECSLMGRVIIATAGDDNICSDAGTRPRADVHAEITPIVVDFLSEQLNP
jgi:predicted dienelactone hydrolase